MPRAKIDQLAAAFGMRVAVFIFEGAVEGNAQLQGNNGRTFSSDDRSWPILLVADSNIHSGARGHRTAGNRRYPVPYKVTI